VVSTDGKRNESGGRGGTRASAAPWRPAPAGFLQVAKSQMLSAGTRSTAQNVGRNNL